MHVDYLRLPKFPYYIKPLFCLLSKSHFDADFGWMYIHTCKGGNEHSPLKARTTKPVLPIIFYRLITICRATYFQYDLATSDYVAFFLTQVDRYNFYIFR